MVYMQPVFQKFIHKRLASKRGSNRTNSSGGSNPLHWFKWIRSSKDKSDRRLSFTMPLGILNKVQKCEEEKCEDQKLSIVRFSDQLVNDAEKEDDDVEENLVRGSLRYSDYVNVVASSTSEPKSVDDCPTKDDEDDLSVPRFQYPVDDEEELAIQEYIQRREGDEP